MSTMLPNPDTPISPMNTSAQSPESNDHPEQEYQPGDLAAVWSGPIAPASLSDAAQKELVSECRMVGNKDVAARRWEVEQEWELRLYHRGNQNLLPRRGGGWVVPPYSTVYNQNQGNRGQTWFGQETNIIAAYSSIITAALGRDLPQVRFEPQDPKCDPDITAADAATRYSRLFAHNNDLLTFQDQLLYYLLGGRAIICCDYVLDAQKYGREQVPSIPENAVPENESALSHRAAFFMMRHGETALNREDRARGRSEAPLDGLGQTQVEQAADFMKDHPVVAIISSPVERARESAQALSSILGVPVTYDDRLASFDLGNLAGRPTSDMKQVYDEAKANPNEPVGDSGESWSDFTSRISNVLGEILSQFAQSTPLNSPPPVLLVTHDSVIRTAGEMLNGEGGWLSGFTPPGGVALCEPLPDMTFRLHPVWPSTPPLPPSHRSRPKGREVVSCYGKLEAHTPINCQSLDEMPFVQLCREYDVAVVKAMFPDKADSIHPGGGGGGGENELDRIARINVNLALDASYVTGDSMVRDVTVRRTFFRPSMFMNCADPEVRAELLETFPEGCEVVMAGNTFIHARACSMDDHLTLVQAFPGTGMNRLGLASTMLSVQKRLNNWLSLLNDYFIRCVPNRYVDAKTIDPSALMDQSNIPGNVIPVLDPDGAPINPQSSVFVEQVPTPQPSMIQFIQLFMEQVPQLLSGATPTLFGAMSNTDTPVGTASLQRDQALARLALTWHAITEATARYFLQAVQLAARCRTSDICGAVGSETIRVEMSELKGKCLARPEANANFPETWSQKQFRLTQLLQDVNNPVIAKILEHPMNLKLAKEAVGIEGFTVLDAEGYEKQLGELEELRHGAPLPNPQFQQAMQNAQGLLAQAQTNPDMLEAAQQALQAAEQIPPLVSSVQIDVDFDQHAAELQCCVDFLNGCDGRRMKNGTAREREGFANVRLHAMEHKAQIKAPAPEVKPPHISMNYRDLPPASAAQALELANVPASPTAVAGERMASTQLKRMGKTPFGTGAPPNPAQ